MATFVSVGEAYFALAIEWRLWGLPVLPEAARVGALSVQLRCPRSRSATSASRRFATFSRSRPMSAEGRNPKFKLRHSHAGMSRPQVAPDGDLLYDA
jgi:hypothetical protein